MAEFRVTTDRDGSRSFNDHDDRWTRGGGSGRYRGRGGNFNRRPRRGGGYGYGGSSYNRGRGGYSGGRGRGGDRDGPGPRSRLDDDGDETMGNSETKDIARYNPYGRSSRGNFRGNSKYRSDNRNRPTQIGGDAGIFKRLGLPLDRKTMGDSDWYKVTIPWGKKTEKDFILKSINDHIDVPFVPTYFHYEDKNAVFYVNDSRAAEGLKSTTKRVTMPNGYKMTILVKPSQPPNIPMGKEEIDKLKVCMSNRYDPATKALNLSCLHTDQELAQSNLFMCLARPQVMSNVVKVIKENIPELVQLDVSNNKLQSLEHLGGLVPSTPDMKVLNLANNKINMLEELRKVQKWKIDWLTLDGNPLCDKFNDHTAYVSGVRRLFPKVLKLDTTDLPPPITFDIEARTDLPKSKDSYFPNDTVKNGVVKFLKDYFLVYDSDDRTGLAGAYHETAMFSLSTSYNPTVQNKQTSLSTYIDETRNLLRVYKDTSRKFKTLKNGNKIVAQLCLLPKTQHDPNSFVVDCNFATAQMISFNIQGVFKEVDKKSDKPPMRAFSRTFVTVASGSGMVIVNDVLTVTNASPDQIQTAFKNPAPTPSSSPIPQTSPTEPFAAAGLTEIQTQMVASFMNDSRMNSEWSAKCLVQNNWEYAKAGQNFLELQQKGLIPPEAFKT
ncbi:nuclear RNA export factor 1-like [Mya arenaria]|uniref:nuclear RNA export factor 1-like n=1 Tax=Mya arenaria TaxID=6604 RepID=UPI0022E3F693|nr:nuclear RNA export factor 1-like [Mya arenaria]